MRRLPSTGPARCTAGALKYFSITRSATAATSRHHCAASPPVKGSLETRRSGFAPRAASRRTHSSTFWRYRVVVGVQGVGTEAPKSSLIAIQGVAQPVVRTAKS